MAPDIDVAPAAPFSAVARSAAVPEGGGSADRPVIGAADERQEAATARTSSLETRPAAHVQLHSPHLPTFPSHHGSPFAAVAALLAASLQRAERGGATHTHLDVLLPESHAGSCLAEESGDRQGHAAGSAATAGAEASAAAQQAEPELPHQGHQDVKAPAASQSTAAGPSLMHSQQQPVLRIEDDAAGLSPQQLRRSLGIPSLANSASSLVAADTGGASLGSACRHAASSPASQWPDFVHAALRLGSTVLVLTKRQGRGASVGLLHVSPAPSGRGEAWLEAAVLDFAADGSWRLTPGGAAINQATPSNASAASALAWHAAAAAAAAETAGSAWTAAAGMICQRWPDGASEAQLAAELAAMPDQGTCLLIAGLYTRAMGDAGTAGAAGAAYELDWSTDPSDVQLGEGQWLSAMSAADSAQQGGQQPPQQRQQQQQQQQQQGSGRPLDPELQRCTLLRSSLRAYMAVLFLRWPEGWRLRLRGTDVEQQWIRDWMRWPAREEYRPRGIRDEVDEHGFQMQHVVSIHLGMLRDAPNTSMQGICIYHRNRLVKPFWRVYSSATVGRGVIGLLEADFLAPTPDWQDFERSHVLSKLEAFLKRAIPSYYKRHVHLLTGGLPQAKRGPGRQYPGQAAGEAAGPLKGMQMAGIGLQGSHSAHHGGLCLQPQQHMLLAVQHAQRAQLAAALPGQQHVHQRLALPALSFGISGPAAGAAQPQHSLAAIMQGLLASLSAASQPAPLPAQNQGTAVQQQPGPPPDLGRALLIAAQQVAGPAAALAAALQQAQQAQGQQQELLQAVLALLAEQAAAPPAGPASSALLSSFQPLRQPLQHPQPAPAPLPPSPFGAVQSSAAALLSQLQQLANAGSAPPVSAPMQAQLLQQLGALAESSESGRLASTALGEPGDMHRLSSSGTQAVPTLAPAGQLQLQAQQQQQQQQQHVQQQHMGNLHMAAQAPGGQPKPAACFVRKGVDPASSRPNSRPSSPKRRRHA